MSTVLPAESLASVRHHPDLAALFKSAENRHFTDGELGEYRRLLPAFAPRAEAARLIRDQEEPIVRTVVDEVMALYPFSGEYAHTKCIRDIRSVSAYATLAMLMNDPSWLRDKLLLWLRSMLQAFEFPDRPATAPKVLFPQGDQDERLSRLKPHQRSIYDAYSRLQRHYHRQLPATAFALIGPYLQQAVDILPA